MRYFVALCLVGAGAIHLLPLAGVLGAERLAVLYGITTPEPNLELLLRHRAVLFGLVGGLLVGSALHPPLRRLALGAGFVSAASFLLLAGLVPGINAQLSRVVRADILALALLVGAAIGQWRLQSVARTPSAHNE